MNLQVLSLEPLPPTDRSVPNGGSSDFTHRSSVPPLRGEYSVEREIQKEKPWHRVAAYMLASGARPKKVAEELSVAEATVWNVSRQKWFREMVATIIDTEFHGNVERMLASAATEAMLIVTDIAANGANESVRLKAAQDILDRHRGKPTNFVHHVGGRLSENPKDEMVRLEEELKKEGALEK